MGLRWYPGWTQVRLAAPGARFPVSRVDSWWTLGTECLVLPSVCGFPPVAHLGGEGAGGVGGGQQGGVASGAGSLIRTHPAFTPFMCWKEAWEPTSRKLPKPRIPHI